MTENLKLIAWLTIATNFCYFGDFAYAFIRYSTLPAPRPQLLILVGLGALLLAVGSLFFHWTELKWARRFDEFGMYALFTPLAAWALHVLIGGPEWPWVVGTILLVLLELRFLHVLNSFYMMAGLGAVIGVCLFLIGPWTYAAGVVAIFGVALALRSLPKPSEHGLRHAGWHVVSAAGVGVVIAFLSWALYLSP